MSRLDYHSKKRPKRSICWSLQTKEISHDPDVVYAPESFGLAFGICHYFYSQQSFLTISSSSSVDNCELKINLSCGDLPINQGSPKAPSLTNSSVRF